MLAVNKLSVDDFRAGIDRIKADTEAYGERRLAQFFACSGWTQREIAEEIGKSQKWVDYQLRYGRFLDWVENNCSQYSDLFSSLTEGKFRRLWQQTNGDDFEAIRFNGVWTMLQAPLQITDTAASYHVTSPLLRADGTISDAGRQALQDINDAADAANEWFTPPSIIEKVRGVLGAIDLDPASCEAANEVIGASRFFSKDDDGLKEEWSGRVWLNPPYSDGMMTPFVDKLLEELPRIDSALMLVNNYTENVWFHKLLKVSDAVCIIKGRTSFWKTGQETGRADRGQVVFYFGKEIPRFAEVFGELGAVMIPHQLCWSAEGCHHR